MATAPKTFALALLLLAAAGCANEGASAADAVNVVDAGNLSVPSYAPLEADGLPGQAAVSEALAKRCDGRAPEIRSVRCEGFEEEPTEFSCTFERRQTDGGWARSGLTMAIDGRHGWIDIGAADCEDTNPELN